MLISIITWSQFFVWGYQRHPQQKLSRPMAAIILGCLAAIAIGMIGVDGGRLQWIDVVSSLSVPRIQPRFFYPSVTLPFRAALCNKAAPRFYVSPVQT